MRFNLILLQMLSSDPRIFLAQANANDGKLELQTPPSSLLPTQGTHGDSAVRARPSAPSTHFSLPSPPYSLLCTFPSPLLPPPYFGRPLQSVHALSSSLSSLFPTLDAHCKVSTHFSLPSPPSSLPWTPTAKCPRTIFFSLLPTLYSPLNYVNSVHKCAGCVPFLFFGIIRGVHPVHCAGK